MKALHIIDTKTNVRDNRTLIRSTIKDDNGVLIAKASSYYYSSYRNAHVFVNVVGSTKKIQVLIEDVSLDEVLDIISKELDDECIVVNERYSILTTFDKSIAWKTK